MSAAHTPGPWEFDGRSGIYAVQFREPGKVFTMEDGTQVPSTEGLVALPYSCGATMTEGGVRANHHANARLMAAAPELLQELISCRAVLITAKHEIKDETAQRVLARRIAAASEAIARATTPRFADVSCSSCGQSFGPGDEGFSHCADHAHLQATEA